MAHQFMNSKKIILVVIISPPSFIINYRNVNIPLWVEKKLRG